ncbi:hypothetical protein [Wenzhouxiangella marina]|uniref:Uncharacterized protein n=1 Tax=Wenzhouxiangella marina TaxID=1579979 RepID=A0A0K0XWF0_9GAMM|nr:hypothetical protein [Wenzhouxiangella marina]AKS41957.1 hypothetical protein WM2015_1587 [Wenzhouxiangella marina]MBB6086276.1 hypothetical protein [Wenzhouxiangella marina]
MSSTEQQDSKHQRRGVIRTVLVLLVVVFGIYLAFIGRAFMNVSGTGS